MINYFLKGIYLANQNIDLYIIGILLYSPTLLRETGIFSSSLPFSLFSIIIFLLYFGFTLSIPLFLIERQQKKKTKYINLFNTVINNTKRIIIPLIVFFFIFIVLFLIIVFILVGLLGLKFGDKQQTQLFFNSISYPIGLTFSIISSFFVFSPVFFSLEKNNIFVSIKNSFCSSFRHLYFIFYLMIISGIFFFLLNLFPKDPISWRLLRTAFYFYVNLVIGASALLYYQDKIKNL